MRPLVCLHAALLLIVGGSASCFAQQPGPATLEGLLNFDEAQKPTAAAEADAGPKRPAGTATRPKDGVQHPDLDKAWADYDVAVAKAAEGVRAAINKQFDAATAKGDLDAAEKWQVIGEKFKNAGELPAENETKAAVNSAVVEYKKAGDELSKAYEAVVKNLTMEKKIAEAKAIRGEASVIRIHPPKPDASATAAPADRKTKETKVAKGWPPVGNYMYAQSGGWKAPITIEPDGVSRCEGRLGSWTRLAPNRIRITLWTGNWIEVQPGDEPGTLFAYKTHDGRTGLMRPEKTK